jgi:hypothetical protein
MKTKAKQSRNIIVALVIVAMISVFSSCATKTVFLSSAIVPAAQGKITIKEDGNKNYKIKVQIVNLADSKRLTPPKNVYVVWILTDYNSSKNIGQIISSSGTMSTNMKATFETVSSFRPSKIFITAEDNADTQYPNSEVVLITDNIN